MTGEPFGTFAPRGSEQAVREAAGRLGPGPFSRTLASLALTLAGGRAARPRDVTLFGTKNVRLHPYDNLCEKRVYATPQFWEPEERAVLRRAIETGHGPFRFVDAGANVGLFSLYAESVAEAAGRPFEGLAIEPDATVRARLEANIAFSGSAVKVRAAALAPEPMKVFFAEGKGNRGENMISAEPVGVEVDAIPLETAVTEAGLTTIDALKIDIEGHEPQVLGAFFARAPESLWPALIIMETLHLADAMAGAGWLGRYRQEGHHRRSAVLVRSD